MAFWQSKRKLAAEIEDLRGQITEIKNQSGPDVQVTLNDVQGMSELFGIQSTLSGMPISSDMAMRIGAVFGCVRLISGCISSCDFTTMKRTGDQLQNVQPDLHHELYRLLRFAPNPFVTISTFWKFIMQHKLLSGNAYVWINRFRDGRVKYLLGLRPQRVIPYQAWQLGFEQKLPSIDPFRLYYYVTLENGKFMVVDQDDMLHFPNLGWDGWKGISTTNTGAQAFGLALAEEEHGARYFGQGMMQDTAIVWPAKLSKDTSEQFKAHLRERNAGLANSFLPLILSEGAKIEKLSLDANAAQLIPSREFSLEDICRFFGTPPIMIGHATKTTCLTGNTKIFTDRGPKNISDVMAGDIVWSLGSDNEFRIQEVVSMTESGDDYVYSIKTSGRFLEANGQHKVLVRRKFPDPQLGVGGYRKIKWKNVWIMAADLRVGDYLIGVHSLPDRGHVSSIGERELTVEFLELCGLFMGDGNIVSCKGNGLGLCFAHAEAASYIGHYHENMLKEFETSANEGPKTAEQRTKKIPKIQRKVRSTRITSKLLVEEFRSLGLDGKAYSKRLPGWMFYLSRHLKLAFLRGYLDADGACNTRGWITYSSCNSDLLEDVKHLCMGIGIPCGKVTKVARKKTANIINGRPVISRRDMYQLYLCNQEANKEIGSHNPRDAQRLDDARKPSRMGRFDPRYLGRGHGGDRPGTGFDILGAHLQAIVSIEKSKEKVPVYDLAVEGDHTFIANGLVVHNSWGSGVEQMAQWFVKFTLNDHLTDIEQEVERKLFGDGIHFAKFNELQLLRGDTATRANYLKLALGSVQTPGWMTPNEARDSENMPPDTEPDSNTLFRPPEVAPDTAEEPDKEPPTGGTGDGTKDEDQNSGT